MVGHRSETKIHDGQSNNLSNERCNGSWSATLFMVVGDFRWGYLSAHIACMGGNVRVGRVFTLALGALGFPFIKFDGLAGGMCLLSSRNEFRITNLWL